MPDPRLHTRTVTRSYAGSVTLAYAISLTLAYSLTDTGPDHTTPDRQADHTYPISQADTFPLGLAYPIPNSSHSCANSRANTSSVASTITSTNQRSDHGTLQDESMVSMG
jgi:hypothetical protein